MANNKTKTNDKMLNQKVPLLMIIRSEEQLANAVRRLRKIKSLSQVELAKKAGVTQPTISRVEKGSKAIEIGTIFLIFSALEVDFQIIPRGIRTNSLEGLL